MRPDSSAHDGRGDAGATAWSREHAAAYVRDGVAVMRALFSESEVSRMIAETERLWAAVDLSPANPRVQWRRRVDGSQVADRLDPVLDISPLFQEIATDRRLVGPATAILGSAPAVFKCKLISKWRGTQGYALHQDYPYWELLGIPPEQFVNVVVALDRCDAANGAIEVFPGLHHERIPPPASEPLDADEARIDLGRGRMLDLEPGDVATFHSMMPHRSGPNASERDRQALTFTYTWAAHGDLTPRYVALRDAKDLLHALKWSPNAPD